MVQPIPLRPADSSAKAQTPGTQAASHLKLVPRLTAEEREFLPATIELIETPFSPTLRFTAWALCALVAAAVIWASLSHIDMVAVADGKVVPLGQVKVVQPLETAMIRAIHVDEGDHVKASELLVDLDLTEAKADLDTLLYNWTQAELDAEVARVLLSLNVNEPFQGPEAADPELVAQNHSQAQREIEKQLATIASFEADIAQKDAALKSNDAAIERAQLTIPLLEEKNETAKGLYDKRYGTRPPVLDSEQALVEKRAELKSAETNVQQIQAERRSIQAKLAEAKAGYMADASDRRTKALMKITQLKEDIKKARQKESYRRLVAPVDGTVQGLKIHTPGAVVTTADTLMTIVPDDTGIEVDCLVPNKTSALSAKARMSKSNSKPFRSPGTAWSRAGCGNSAATPRPIRMPPRRARRPRWRRRWRPLPPARRRPNSPIPPR
jgi:hemolysin D